MFLLEGNVKWFEKWPRLFDVENIISQKIFAAFLCSYDFECQVVMGDLSSSAGN